MKIYISSHIGLRLFDISSLFWLFFHAYAWRLALLISRDFQRSPWVLFSAIAPLIFYKIRQVLRSKCAQRYVLAYATNWRYQALFVFEHGLHNHPHPWIAFMMILLIRQEKQTLDFMQAQTKKAKIAVPDGHCTLTCWNWWKDNNFFWSEKIFKVKNF